MVMKTKKYLYILIGVISIIAIIAGAIIINNLKFPVNPEHSNESNESGDNTQSEETDVSILCDDITMFIDDEFSQLNITIKSNEVYTTNYTYDKQALNIVDQKVYAYKTGTYLVTVLVTTTSSTYSDTFTVTVLDTITDVSVNIYKDNEKVDKLFVGETYVLELTYNAKMYTDFILNPSENISNFKNIETNISNKILFSFTVSSVEDTVFVFNYRNFSKSFTYETYEYISNFDIDISNGFENNILTLYIFNNNYVSDANSNNIFNETPFSINVSEKNLSLFEVKILDENIACIKDNKIIASSVGKTTLNITALDGSDFTESITIYVKQVEISELTPTFFEKTLNVGESFEIVYTYSPNFAITDFEITVNGEVLTENIFYANAEGEYTITILDKISNLTANILVTVNEIIEPSEVYYKVEFNQSFLDEYNGTFENDILTIYAEIPFCFSFSFLLLDEYEGEISTNITVSSTIRYDIDPISNMVNLYIYEKGTLDITLTLVNDGALTDISYTFKIVVL